MKHVLAHAEIRKACSRLQTRRWHKLAMVYEGALYPVDSCWQPVPGEILVSVQRAMAYRRLAEY